MALSNFNFLGENMSDYDMERLTNELNTIINGREWHTPLLKDIEDGEFYVIQGIYVDEDDDVIMKIQHI